MKKQFDRKAVEQQFQLGDMMLVLLPTPSAAFNTRFSVPFVVKKVSEKDYIIRTQGRRKKTRVCNVDMLKPYHSRGADGRELQSSGVMVVRISALVEIQPEKADLVMSCDRHRCGRLKNSEFLSSIDEQL